MDEIHISKEEFIRQSLQNFHAQFPSEGSCLRLFPSVCRACGSKMKKADLEKRSVECSKCKTKTWRTAGTYFHGLKRIRPTFARIWMYEDRAIVSIKKFSELFDIPYATAWEIDAKIKAVFEKEMDKHDAFELVSTLFNPVICKRSILSLAEQHPSYEDDEEPLKLEEPEQRDQDQLTVYSVLKPQPIDFDNLLQSSGLPIAKFIAALTSLDIEGAVTRHQGNKFSLTKTNPMALVSSQEKDAIQQISAYASNFHGISRKYLQLYLASFWSHFGRNRWSKGTLVESIMKYARLTRAQLLAYISPKVVRIPVRDENVNSSKVSSF